MLTYQPTKTHPIARGSRANVYNRTYGGQIILEGEAVIIRPASNVANHYLVQFPGEDMQVTRFVDPSQVVAPPANPPTHVPKRKRGKIGAELNKLLKNARPYSTTFLFMEAGCEAVGQGTPLNHAIEKAMKESFERWAASWIKPIADELEGKA